MKLSKYFYVTLRETPSDATMPSHIFLMRGGYIKPVSTGIFPRYPEDREHHPRRNEQDWRYRSGPAGGADR